MHVLFLEPFDGGSHREFVEGLREHSRHAIDVASLPARLWKWRLRAAGLTLAQRVPHPERYDMVVATGLLDLAQVQAVWGGRAPPVLLYLHERAKSPIRSGAARRVGGAGAALAGRDQRGGADHVVFNSEFHRAALRARLPEVIEQLPDEEARPECRGRSSTGARACSTRAAASQNSDASRPPEPPVVIWNQRWEFDKDPGTCGAWRYWASGWTTIWQQPACA